jgi:predicted porin
MKKKLLATTLSVMSAMSMADVSLYGKLAAGVRQDGFQNSTEQNTTSIQDFGSYFGIRGYDQVYGQTSAIWQIEQLLDLVSGQAYSVNANGGSIVPRGGASGLQNGKTILQMNTLASGESYLGLQGLWGRIRLGNLSNYMRSSMGAIDWYTYTSGADGAGVYSRTVQLLPSSIRFDSPTWGGFSFAAMYAFQTSAQQGVYGLNTSNTLGPGINGFYAGGVYSIGASWIWNYFSVKAGTMINENVGSYTTNLSNNLNPINDTYPSAAYKNAYANRIEVAYNDPDGAVGGIGFQTTSGWGFGGWPNSGGSWGNYVTNPGYNFPGLNSNQFQTQEAALSLGWHLGPWTPKVSYLYGNNLMYNSDVLNVAVGNGNQIPNSGYQQVIGELDWNITPRTIVFINYGQIWYGNTLANVSFCGNSCANVTTVDASNRAARSQGTGGIGFSHTF